MTFNIKKTPNSINNCSSLSPYLKARNIKPTILLALLNIRFPTPIMNLCRYTSLIINMPSLFNTIRVSHNPHLYLLLHQQN